MPIRETRDARRLSLVLLVCVELVEWELDDGLRRDIMMG
jgi:hypothetical protein